jgi:hypothetical protein
MKILDPAPLWTVPRSRYIDLWHGCTMRDKQAIESSGVDPMRGRPDTDFGRGFYTTTVERQARAWAWERFYGPKYTRTTGNQPVVLRFRLDRYELAKLSTLAFVLGHYSIDDFWSLVQHCRQSTPPSDPPPHIVNDHEGPIPFAGNWYDVVMGPVAAFWNQRYPMADADQISFHTDNAAALLTAAINSGNTNLYESSIVV